MYNIFDQIHFTPDSPLHYYSFGLDCPINTITCSTYWIMEQRTFFLTEYKFNNIYSIKYDIIPLMYYEVCVRACMHACVDVCTYVCVNICTYVYVGGKPCTSRMCNMHMYIHEDKHECIFISTARHL